MTATIIITFCALILLAYVFDITSSRTKIPSVILLLLLGWGVKQVTVLIGLELPHFERILPVIGTIGLILIVLDGSLGLEVDRSKLGIVRKSFLGAFFPLIALALLMAWALSYFAHAGFQQSLTNALPFCVISSAIAIPSVRNLAPHSREFVIYESSLSDILGVLVFNFVSMNEVIDEYAFGQFGIQLVVITVVSFLATIGLAVLLKKIEHEVKFVPIIVLVILIYAISKHYHLQGLIFIMFFGLFIGNLSALRGLKWIDRLNPDELIVEVHKFKSLTNEGTFLIRVLFFLLFGYSIEISEVFNGDTMQWAFAIVFFIYALRAIQLKLSGIPLSPLLFIAPRGLITILLFLSIAATQTISIVNKSLIIQVILLTALMIMIGMVTTKAKPAVSD